MERLAAILRLDHNWEGLLVLDVKQANLEDAFTFERAIRFLSLTQQAKIHQLKTSEGRHRAVCNRLLQLFGCSIVNGVPLGEVQVEKGTYGKPRLKNCPQISFSMSNGHKYVAQYISRRKEGKPGELGVDIASSDDYIGEQDLVTFREVFSSAEYDYLQSLSNATSISRAFATYWSLKECYSKYTGLGLNCDLSKLDYGKITIPESGSGLQKVMDGIPMLFYSIWISPGKEIVTVCRQDDLNERDRSHWLEDGPQVYNLRLEDIIRHFEQVTY